MIRLQKEGHPHKKDAWVWLSRSRSSDIHLAL